MALVFGFAGLSKINAQKQNQERNGNQRLENMQEELSLTEDQMDQMKTLNDQFRTEMQEMRKNESLTREEFHETMEQQREEHHSQIMNILDEEQKVKFDAFAKQGRGPHFENRHPGNGRNKYSDEQIGELKEKRIEFDNELSEDEKAVIADFRLKREEWHNEKCEGNNKGNFNRGHGRNGNKQHREEMEPMIEIVKKHKESLTAILEEYRPEKPENCPNENHQRRQGTRAGKGERPGFMAMHFLMMDPLEIDLGQVNEQSNSVIIYPNPALNFISISYDLPAENNVSVELLNKHGKVVEVIDQSNQVKGINELQYDVSKLAPGEMYFIRVTYGSIVLVDKFIKM